MSFVMSVVRGVLPPQLRHRLYRAYEGARSRIDLVRRERGLWYRRMAAAQHLDFEEVERLVTPDDGWVIDVGAESGEVSRFFLRLGFDVLAIEPEAANFAALSRLRGRRFHAVQAALSDRSGTGFLDVKPGTHYHRLADRQGDRTQPITVLTARELIARFHIDRIAVFKVDVEGDESVVLRGLFASDVLPTVVVAEFTRETLPELLGVIGERYRYLRFVCRWTEATGLTSQIRSGVFDGNHPMVFEATWGNLICSTKPFRLVHPLI